MSVDHLLQSVFVRVFVCERNASLVFVNKKDVGNFDGSITFGDPYLVHRLDW